MPRDTPHTTQHKYRHHRKDKTWETNTNQTGHS
nr:MAG TPA_asm: hypothetical protein [Caudoviricetes sp.]